MLKLQSPGQRGYEVETKERKDLHPGWEWMWNFGRGVDIEFGDDHMGYNKDQLLPEGGKAFFSL